MKKIYDGKDLWVAYMGWGAAASNKRLKDYAESTFGANSQMGPGYAMWKWAFQNPEEAWPYYKEWFFQKNPELPQPEFKDFIKTVLDKAVRTPTVYGGKKAIQRFSAKYGVKADYNFEPGDVAQVVRRSSPLFQVPVIVQGASGEDVDVLIVNSDGKRTGHTVSVYDLATVGKAVYAEADTFVVSPLTKVPKLQRLARDRGMTLTGIDLPELGDAWKGARFNYSYIENGVQQTTTISHDDFETGVEAEIQRMQEAEVPV